jgi:dihydrodipicolinate synthase/N-acetylneuraminate lyase
MISGTLAASVTPLKDGGLSLDEEAFVPLVDFLADSHLDGLFALGTTGEGILFSVSERQRVAKLFVEASAGRLAVAVHCGAQTTPDTVKLAEHAAQLGVSAVAVISPPYFMLDSSAILTHLQEAAKACDPTPFYVYEFHAASGYPVPLDVIATLRETAGNFVGLKVSDTPWDQFSKYLLPGLDIFVGPEALIHDGISGGAVGAVSALATAFPELVIEAVRSRDTEATRRVAELRLLIESFPRHAALKRVLASRGVPVRGDVRPPLRSLTAAEDTELDRLLAAFEKHDPSVKKLRA